MAHISIRPTSITTLYSPVHGVALVFVVVKPSIITIGVVRVAVCTSPTYILRDQRLLRLLL